MRALGADASQDASTQAATLGGALFVLGGLVVASTEWLLPAGVDRAALLGLSVVAVAVGVAVPALPWRRWPQRAFLVLPILGQILLAIGWQVARGAMPYYLSLYVLCYLYAGITQESGVSLWLLPVTAATVGREAVGSSTPLLVNALIVTVIAVVVAEVLATYTTRERRAREHLSLLLAASQRLATADTVEEAAQVISELANALLRCDLATVFVADRDQPDLYRNRSPGASGALDVNIASEQTGIGVALRTGETIFVADADMSPIVSRRLAEATNTKSALFLAFPGRVSWVGAIALTWSTPRRHVDPLAQRVLEGLGTQAGRVLERLLTAEVLTSEVRTDPLTGLGNRRSWQAATNLIKAGDTVIMIDLDHFKAVNDRLGHDGGDRALRAMAACLRTAARHGDCVTRYGGEEFALLLLAAGADGAREFLNRLAALWDVDGAVTTYSAGYAVHHDDDTAQTTIRNADNALYQAKAQGRNRTIQHSP